MSLFYRVKVQIFIVSVLVCCNFYFKPPEWKSSREYVLLALAAVTYQTQVCCMIPVGWWEDAAKKCPADQGLWSLLLGLAWLQGEWVGSQGAKRQQVHCYTEKKRLDVTQTIKSRFLVWRTVLKCIYIQNTIHIIQRYSSAYWYDWCEEKPVNHIGETAVRLVWESHLSRPDSNCYGLRELLFLALHISGQLFIDGWGQTHKSSWKYITMSLPALFAL